MKKIFFIVIVVAGIAASATVTFKTKKLELGEQKLTVEIAESDEQRSRGLMFRRVLNPGSGMLFIFETERPLSFWMKNTFIPLSIGFFDKDKVLIDIQDMSPVESELEISPPSYPSKKPAQYALEVPQGWFHKNKVNLGTKFVLK